MKNILALHILTLLLLILSSCNNDGNENQKRLAGTISGQDWEYKYAKAFFNSVDNVFDAELYGTSQTEEDPCNIFISGEAHISIQIPAESGNLSIPSDVTVVFEQPGTGNEAFTATSGFIDITEATSQTISGYISAVYDDNNTVEGSFSFISCN